AQSMTSIRLVLSPSRGAVTTISGIVPSSAPVPPALPAEPLEEPPSSSSPAMHMLLLLLVDRRYGPIRREAGRGDRSAARRTGARGLTAGSASADNPAGDYTPRRRRSRRYDHQFHNGTRGTSAKIGISARIGVVMQHALSTAATAAMTATELPS